MATKSSPVSYACPACGTTGLAVEAALIRCASCGSGYPRIGGIPWLFREPSLVLGEWQNRLTLYLEEFRQEARVAGRELEDSRLTAATRARLEQLEAAYEGQVGRVGKLLAPLAMQAGPAPQALMTAFGVEVPRRQDLHSYYVNLHRDWSWGTAENEAAATMVTSVLAPDPVPRALVLGAGGCRLAFDLHQKGAFQQTVALDINPLLLLTASRLLSGETVELYEFPIAPRTKGDHAVLRALRAPGPSRQGLEFVFADALNAPFAAGSFDVVLTPWLVDIIDGDFADLCARINRLVRPGGTWVNFGSVSFMGLRPSERLGVEEVYERVVAAGFRLTAREEREIPYMRSPASRHARQETVLAFAATKHSEAVPPARRPILPAWLTDPRQPIPLDEQFEVTAIASRLQAVALSLIDGQRTAADLARFLVEQQLLAPEAALAAVRGLLLRLYDGRRRRPLET